MPEGHVQNLKILSQSRISFFVIHRIVRTSIVDNLEFKHNRYKLDSIAFRFCILMPRPPQSMKLQRQPGKHDDDCGYFQKKKQRVDGPQGLSQKFADNPSILTQCHKLKTIHVDWVKDGEY